MKKKERPSKHKLAPKKEGGPKICIVEMRSPEDGKIHEFWFDEPDWYIKKETERLKKEGWKFVE